MLRDPLAVKNFLRPSFESKIFAKPEKYLEPLDLPATVGQSCVGVCACVSVCVCESECVEERRRDVETLKSPK